MDVELDSWGRWAGALALAALAWLHRRLWSKQDSLEERINEVETDMSGIQAETRLARIEEGKFRQDVKESLSAINTKLDRVFYDERERILQENRDLRRINLQAAALGKKD